MALALKLAAKGLYTTDPNPRVGCVIAQGEEVVGEGWHVKCGEAHAEVFALAGAGERAKGATVYLTLEPCSHLGKTPPCVEALINSKVQRVVCAMEDPNPEVNGRGLQKLRDAGIQTEVGLMQAEAEALNPGFCQRMRHQRPYVRVKMAMSLDARTALKNGDSQWISGESARLDVQRWRARSSAIMTGINTVLLDDPSLSLRLEGLALSGDLEPGQSDIVHHPLRIVLDSQLKLPLNARLLSVPGDILIVTAVEDEVKRAALINNHVEVVVLPRDESGRPNLHDLMNVLAKAQLNEVMVESGHILTGELLNQQLVDEVILYVAPALLGNTALGLFKLPELSSIKNKIRLEFTDIRSVGDDLRITARPIYS